MSKKIMKVVMMKKKIKILITFFLTALAGLIGYFYFAFVPIMTGMAAKTMCSCVYVMGRDPESVRKKEVSVFPGLSGVRLTFYKNELSRTAPLLGKASKSLFRKGVGCTLLAERSEDEV